jgi:putative hemolysin
VTAPFSVAGFLPDRLPSLAARALDALTGLTTLQRLYEAHPWTGRQSFAEHALATLDVSWQPAHGLEHVPATGPVVVVANHPHGAVDGLALAAAMATVRPDVKLLGNALLCSIPEMRSSVIPVDAFRQGQGRNAVGLREARAWLDAGHALVVFPAGEVSHVRARSGRLVDGPWREGAARLAAASSAPMVPVFIEGRNSAFFERAGRISPWLRTALLPRELLRMTGRRAEVRVGRAVSARRLAAVGDTAAQTAYLRIRTYGLAQDDAARGRVRRAPVRKDRVTRVAPPVPIDALANDVDRLPASACLVEQGPWRVYLVRAHQAPSVLQEIGRLREVTFRSAGEGTGRARDLDRFDWHYRHLFVWHVEARAVVGAYRLAATDDVLSRQGLRGFYTRTLFRYAQALLNDLGPAIELGRSFVREEYQRDYQPLLLLWRGIGSLVAAEPRYRMLFGPVSISADYASATRTLLAKCLLTHRASLLGRLVQPRRPIADDAQDTEALVKSRVAADLKSVDELVRELEADKRGLPVLLRHYLKLNAKLLAFSEDPAFGNVLDGLVVVDLLDVDRALLARYLGRDAAGAFLAAHAHEASRRVPDLADALA